MEMSETDRKFCEITGLKQADLLYVTEDKDEGLYPPEYLDGLHPWGVAFSPNEDQSHLKDYGEKAVSGIKRFYLTLGGISVAAIIVTQVRGR